MTIKPIAPYIRAAACAWLLVAGAAAAQQVTVSRSSTLHAEPRADAPAVAQLEQGSAAQVIGRQGAWVNVKSAAGAGWLYSFNVSYAAAGGAAAPSSKATPRRRNVTSTIGIRGLEKEDLKNATFDAKQLDALDSFAGDDKGGKGAAKKK